MVAGSGVTVMPYPLKFRWFTAVQRLLRLMIAVSIAVVFWNEIKIAVTGYINLIFKMIPPTPETSTTMLKVLMGFVFVCGVYFFFVFWLAHFVLPITRNEQRIPGFKSLLRHGFFNGRWHGPAVFVRDGVVQGKQAEFRKKYPGVAFLDMRSAMTLDKLHHIEDEELSDDPLLQPPKVRFSLVQSGAAYISQLRTVGPGLVFTKKHESITGSVDLRTQVRVRPKVMADTRDGIRVSTNVNAVFTLGQPPEVLDVCVGGENLDQILVIEWEKNAPGYPKKIAVLKPEFGQEEATEIWNFIHTTPRSSSVTSDVPPEKSQFTFDEKRVEQAVYSFANRTEPDPNGVKKWTEWPADVAAEKFRILLSEYPYLSLYGDPRDNGENKSPKLMKELKDKLRVQVRNTGVLAYRVVKQLNGLPPVVGEMYPEDRLVFFPAQTFKTPAVLRGRGIKVIAASFGELEPVDKRVREQLRNAWLSAKKKEETLKVADYELEATRIINHARIRTQQDMNYHLAKLLEQQEYPREALAMLVYQELEAAAANPETRKLLPENTLSMLNDIGQLLLQSQRDENGFGNERKFISPEEDQ
jgi:hypothetical protein